MRRIPLLMACTLFSITIVYNLRNSQILAYDDDTATEPSVSGQLQLFDKDGKFKSDCPLKHTDVNVQITGFIARVEVTQQFDNTSADNLEALYTFPMSQNSAVSDMTMEIGDRVIKGKIKTREDARAIYEGARTAGKTATLLDQERPNIFRQSVANIAPGEKIKITITYVEMLKYDSGSYEFVFPMVVAPRYIPNPNTVDASRISPPIAEQRAGHDISLIVNLESGVPIQSMSSPLHEIDVQQTNSHSALIKLKDNATIPNRDFILNYKVAANAIEDAVIAHTSSKGGFFTLILQPPDNTPLDNLTPKELVFVLDTSGSMSGFPLEKAKEVVRMALAGLNPQDTFNLITFSGDTEILFPKPVPSTPDNLRRAQDFLESRSSGGGTEMMKAIRAALDPSDATDHIRIACFMTDGEVGNDFEIISEIQKHPNARVFAFGIGNSVNRYLLDKMAETGRGAAQYVTLKDDGSLAARQFYQRVRNPLLTDIVIDWNDLPVTDLYPERIPDLFSDAPLIITGRYRKDVKGSIRLKGKWAGRSYEREIPIDLPAKAEENAALESLWARSKVDSLMSDNYLALLNSDAHQTTTEEITRLGLQFGLVTQFTSFVAVEERKVKENGQLRTVEVPIELPDGMDRNAISGDQGGYQGGYQGGADFSVYGMIKRVNFIGLLVMGSLSVMATCACVIALGLFVRIIRARKEYFRETVQKIFRSRNKS